MLPQSYPRGSVSTCAFGYSIGPPTASLAPVLLSSSNTWFVLNCRWPALPAFRYVTFILRHRLLLRLRSHDVLQRFADFIAVFLLLCSFLFPS
jgi:hypothetical protein